MPNAGPSPLDGLVQQQQSQAPGGGTQMPVNAQPSNTSPDAQGGGESPLSSLVQRQPLPAGPPPAPSAAQTLAAMKHFAVMKKNLERLMNDPAVGKSNVRPKIFDMAAKMLGDGFMTLPRLMNEIKTLPTDPTEQKKWLMKHLEQVTQAEQAVAVQHADAFPATGNPHADFQSMIGDGEKGKEHADHMDDLVTHYQSRGFGKGLK